MSSCHHCGLPIPPSLLGQYRGEATVENSQGEPEEILFCCRGCQAVFHFVHDMGLDDYYRFRPEPSLQAAEQDPASEMYCDESVAESYLFEGKYHCLLDGLHCAACAWLIERALSTVPEVERAQVNYATSRLVVVPRSGPALAKSAEVVRRLGYRAVAYDPRKQERPRTQQSRWQLVRFGLAACVAGNVMLAALALYCGADDDLTYRPFFQKISLVLTVPVVTFSAWPFWRGALAALRNRQITTDVSIVLGLFTAFWYSVVATILGWQHVYFDTCCTFVFVLLAGRLLEGTARSKAGASIERLLALQTHTAVRWDGQQFVEVPSDQLAPGDLVEVRPGSRIPADGLVQSGRCYIDESHLTGESTPRLVDATKKSSNGLTVYGGSLAIDGRLEVMLTQTGATSLLAQVARFVESSQCQPAPIQRAADRWAQWILPTILLLSLTTLVWHGLDRALSVLIITCPCALGIATPLVVSLATGMGASQGLLFRDGASLETARKLTHVMLDKTGTLTEGQLYLENTEILPKGRGFGLSAQEWLYLGCLLEASSTHPLARAFQRALPSEMTNLATPAQVEDWEQIPGFGLQGKVVYQGRSLNLKLGHPDFFPQHQFEQTASTSTDVYLQADDQLVARFSFRDQIRLDSPALIAELKRRGIQVLLASGDSLAPVAEVARALSINDFRARCLPEQKLGWIEELQGQGAVVGFIGDGLNDAPALKKANLGIAVSNSSELSWEVADLVLLQPGLCGVNWSLRLAEVSWTHLQWNLGVAGLYNIVAIPMAMMGYVTPLLAAVAMPASSLVVISQSLAILMRDIKLRPDSKISRAPFPTAGVVPSGSVNAKKLPPFGSLAEAQDSEKVAVNR